MIFCYGSPSWLIHQVCLGLRTPLHPPGATPGAGPQHVFPSLLHWCPPDKEPFILFLGKHLASGFLWALGPSPDEDEYFLMAAKAQPLPWAPLPPENTPLLWKRILSPCYLHAKVIYSSMYRVNEVVWLMDTNRYCFFDLQNEFHRDWLKLKYANAQWTSCLFISVYACRPISNFFLFSFRILNGSNIF